MVKSYNDPARLGLLYYSNTKTIDAVTVGDNLTIDPFSADATTNLDSVTINTPTPVHATISLSDLGSPVAPGSQNVIFPAVSSTQVNKSFEKITQFQSAVFSSAIIKMTFQNKLPVDVTISGIFLINVSDNSVILQDNSSIPIPVGSDTTVSFAIADNVTVTENINLRASVSSQGSSGQPVNVANDAGIVVTTNVENFSIKKVTADLPPQAPFHYYGKAKVSDSTYIQDVTLKSGQMTLTISNALDLDLNTNIVIHNMYDPNGNEFIINTTLTKSQKNKVIKFPSIAGYSFKSSNLINQLPYDVTVQTSASNGVVTLDKTDSVYAVMNFDNLLAQKFTGKIKPTHISIDNRSFSLGLGDSESKYTLSQINITDANVQIKLKQSAGTQIGYSGQIEGKNSTQTRTMQIPYTILLPGSNTITLDKTEFQNFLNGFTGKLPDSLIIKGDGVANPNYVTGSIASSDSIYGNADVEIPLKLGIGGGTFSDTSNLDISNDVRDKKDKIGKFTVTLELTNGVPAGFSFSGKVYDAANNFLMDLPPNRTPLNGTIAVSAANVDANGKVTSSNSNTINFDLTQDEINKFLEGTKLISSITFYTSGSNTQGVEFRTTDPVSAKIFGSVTYEVSPN